MAPSPTPFSTFMIQFAADPLPRAPRNAPCDRTRRDARLFACGGELCFEAPWEETVRRFETRIYVPARGERLRTYIQEVGFQACLDRRRCGHGGIFESPEEYFQVFFLESKNPRVQAWVSAVVGTRAWRVSCDRCLKRFVREKYGGAKDFDMKVFPYSWRENN